MRVPGSQWVNLQGFFNSAFKDALNLKLNETKVKLAYFRVKCTKKRLEHLCFPFFPFAADLSYKLTFTTKWAGGRLPPPDSLLLIPFQRAVKLRSAKLRRRSLRLVRLSGRPSIHPFTHLWGAERLQVTGWPVRQLVLKRHFISDSHSIRAEQPGSNLNKLVHQVC